MSEICLEERSFKNTPVIDHDGLKRIVSLTDSNFKSNLAEISLYKLAIDDAKRDTEIIINERRELYRKGHVLVMITAALVTHAAVFAPAAIAFRVGTARMTGVVIAASGFLPSFDKLWPEETLAVDGALSAAPSLAYLIKAGMKPGEQRNKTVAWFRKKVENLPKKPGEGNTKWTKFSQSLAANVSCARSAAVIDEPSDIASALRVGNVNIQEWIKDIVNYIETSEELNNDDKNDLAKALSQHQFLNQTLGRSENHATMTAKLQLIFLLEYILTMDKMVTVNEHTLHHSQFGDMHPQTSTSKPITGGSYTNCNYPVPKETIKYDDYLSVSQHIGYSEPGNAVAKAINDLLKNQSLRAYFGTELPEFMIDDSWFTNEMGKAQIQKAEKYIQKLLAPSSINLHDLNNCSNLL